MIFKGYDNFSETGVYKYDHLLQQVDLQQDIMVRNSFLNVGPPRQYR